MEHAKRVDIAKEHIKPSIFTAFDLVADMIWVRDPSDGRLLEINTATARELGYPRGELVGKPVYAFYYDAGDRELGENFSRRVEREGSGFLTISLRKRSGEALETELRGTAVDYDGKKALLVVARAIDQSREKRHSLSLYQAFKQSNDVMFYCDRDGVILDVNDAFTTHYGYTRKEALGRTPRMVKSRHSSRSLYQRMWAGILDPKKGYWRGQIINKAKDGREIPLILTITAVKDASGEIVGHISSAVDMSEQVALQARVAQSETLATIGEMAAVVAHEIRNPLGSIVMAAKQIGSGNLSREDGRMVRQVLQSESQRLNEALNNFLAYARPREVKFERSDLNALLGEVVNIVKSNPDLIEKITVSTHFAAQVEPFPFDPDQIRQVMWNIVLNAVQAMGGHGTLTAETGRDKSHAHFRIGDTGPGIPDSSISFLFKPFHTTKQQGTGLGLAIADRIVKAHGGRIEVESKPRRGTTFCVYLPALED